MGLWGDIKTQTGYDSESDPANRSAIRDLYFKKAEELGYDKDTAEAVLDKEGVFDDERKRQEEASAHAMNVAEMHSPQWQRAMQQMVQNARDPLDVAEEAYRATLKGETAPESPKYRIPDKFLTDKELVDRYMAAKPTGDVEKDAQLAQERRDNPFAAGFRSSVYGTAGISDLPKDQQGIVQRAIAESAGEIAQQREGMSTAQKALSMAQEMGGTMLGSPTTYIAPLLPAASALPVLSESAPVLARAAMAGGRMVLSSPATLYGAASGLEGAKAQENLGDEDVSYLKSAAKGGILGWFGGKMGKPIGELAEGVGARLSPKAAALAGVTGNAAGFGLAGSGAELMTGVHGKITGQDKRSVGDIFSDVVAGYGANMMTGVPQAILAQKAVEIKHKAFKGDMESALELKDTAISHALDKINSRYADIETAQAKLAEGRPAAELSNLPVARGAELPSTAIRMKGASGESQSTWKGAEYGPDTVPPEVIKADADAANRKFDAMDKEADRRRRNDTGSIARNIKGKFLGMGKRIVDNKMMSLSKLYQMEKKERSAIVSEYTQRGMTRNEVLDAMNKGIIPMPVARELAERIKEMPTEMQTMTHVANKILAPAYYGMKAGEARALERYVMARNQISEIERMRAIGKPFSTPIPERQLRAVVIDTEMGKNGPEMEKRANYIFELSRQMIELEHEAGIIPTEERDRLRKVRDHIGTVWLDPASEYRDKNPKGTPSANSSDMFKLLDGGGTWGMDTDVAGIMHQRLVRAQLEAYKNQTGKLLLQYARGGEYQGSKLPSTELHEQQGPHVVSEVPENALGLRVVPEWGSVHADEDYIVVRENGKVVKVAMPKWLKESLEADTEATKAVIRALGVFTMTSVVRKLAVQWNPEFAMANIPRDFARYYRLMAAADPKGWGAADMSAAENFIKANPVSYAAEMTKNIAAIRIDATKKFAHELKNGELQQYQGADWYDRCLKANGFRGVISRDTGSPLHKPGAAGKAYNGLDAALGMCGEFSENLLRCAAFKTLVDRGFTDKRAGQIVGQFLDYNRHGTMSKVWDRIIPFFNVAIQAPRADLRTLRENPQAYLSRIAWSAMSYTAIAMLTYSLDPEGKAAAQTAGRTRSSNAIIPDPVPNKDGSFRMATVPLDQQDRLLAALCDSVVRIQKGLPVDKERIVLAAKDFVSVNPEFYMGIPSWNVISALALHSNTDPYRDRKLSYAPEGVDGKFAGTWHESYDPTKDAQWAISLAKEIYPMVDWQPAAITYAISQLAPSTFFVKTAKTAAAALDPSQEVKLSSIPMVSKVLRDSDPQLPLRTAAEEGQITKSRKDLKRYREVRLESQVKDPDEYLNMMMQKLEDAPDSEKAQVRDRFLEGYKDRILEVDPETKFIQSQTDPSAWETLDKLHPFLENPRVIKKYKRYEAGRDADNQQ